MSKKLMVAAFAFAMALATQASTMFWMVEGSDLPDFEYAKLVANTTGEGTTWSVIDATTKADATDGVPLQVDLGSFDDASYYFAVELCNENGDWVGQSNSVSYNDLVAAGAISSSLAAPDALGSSTQGGGSAANWNNIPEPTSGMLLLVGFAALSLRRRRRV